jgi:hypothetical protein
VHVLNVASHPKFWHSGSFLVQILVLFEYRFIFPKAYDLGWGERILKLHFLFLRYWTFKSYSVEVYCPREYFDACCMPSDRLDYSVLVAAKTLSDGLSLGCFCFRLLYLVNHDEGRAQYEHNMFNQPAHTHTTHSFSYDFATLSSDTKWPQKTLNWMTTVWCSEIVRNLKSKNSVQRKSCKGSLLRGSGTLQS